MVDDSEPQQPQVIEVALQIVVDEVDEVCLVIDEDDEIE